MNEKLKMRRLVSMEKKHMSPEAMELLLCSLMYRLGGEQSFSPEEIDDIRDIISAVTIATDGKNILLRCRTKETIASFH